jgi:hypothetical protein
LGLSHFQKFGMFISGNLEISSQRFGFTMVKTTFPNFHLHAEATSTNERLQSSGDNSWAFVHRSKLRWDGWDMFGIAKLVYNYN